MFDEHFKVLKISLLPEKPVKEDSFKTFTNKFKVKRVM